MSWKLQPPIWKSALPPSKKLLCLALADYADEKGGSIFPSARQMHFKTGLDERTVHRLKRELIRDGILEITEYGGIAGTTRSNNYRLHLDELPEHGGMVPPADTRPPADKVLADTVPPADKVPPTDTTPPGVTLPSGDIVPPTGGVVSHDPIMYSDHLAPSARPSREEHISDTDPHTPSLPTPPVPVAVVTPIQQVAAIPQHAPLQDGIASKDRLAVHDHVPEFRVLPFRMLWRMRDHTSGMGDGTNTLDTALRSYMRSGHTFAEAAGHLAETEHLRPEAFIRRIQSGYSHPMSPEEREQARKTWGTRKGTL